MATDKTPFSRIAPYYSDLIGKYGQTPRACDYGRDESQRIKYKVLSEVMDLSGQRLLDVGCGFATYADFLNERYRDVGYSGLDLTPEMAAHAQATHPGLDIKAGNILDYQPTCPFDVVSANGIFYLIENDPWLEMQKIVRKMFSLATKALVFNSLSIWATDQAENEFYADPVETMAFCRSLTSKLTLRHDYHSRDFTLYLYK